MGRFNTKHLAIVAAIFVIAVQAQPVEKDQNGVQPMTLVSLKGRNLVDEYTLGQQFDGATIIYSYQHMQSFDSVQSEITLDYDYPSANDYGHDNSNVITQITLHVEASDGATTQALVTKGGIGETSVSLQIVAQNSNSLRYMVIIYGKPQ